MSRKPGRIVASAAVAAGLWGTGSPAAAQAFTLPRGVGAVSLVWQYIDNTGHRLSDGYLRETGQSVTTSVGLDVEYGVTDRLSAGVGIPYVFAKYTGGLPALSGQPVDECRCWQSGFQDFSFGARYRFGQDTWAVTPLARFVLPSHGYGYKGEAVVGRFLKEAQVGLGAGVRLGGFLSRANVQATYTYAFVEKALEDISVNRSNVSFGLGYVATRRLYLHATGLWVNTHGGLRLGSVTGNPFPLPGEVNTPERRAESERLRRVLYRQVAGGVTYDAGPVDVFASYTKYVWGRDAHDGQAYNLGVTWYFDRSK